jgi:hypothetical protein
MDINAEKITVILKDKYHNNLTTTEIRTKHGISQKVWNEINKKFSVLFIDRYGKKAPEAVKISCDELSNLWGDKQQDIYQTSNKKYNR